MLDLIHFTEEGISGGILIPTHSDLYFATCYRDNKTASSGEGREICLCSDCLYFTQTHAEFLRGRRSPLHTLLKESD